MGTEEFEASISCGIARKEPVRSDVPTFTRRGWDAAYMIFADIAFYELLQKVEPYSVLMIPF
jgi:hypothetical protein